MYNYNFLCLCRRCHCFPSFVKTPKLINKFINMFLFSFFRVGHKSADGRHQPRASPEVSGGAYRRARVHLLRFPFITIRGKGRIPFSSVSSPVTDREIGHR